mmetsp:Transcript_52480/g.125402  ORF Transcript_52480/g.125402 Transcript_52480/m.125402 type:complete len:263 (+) Transcript_52480:61-849(+)
MMSLLEQPRRGMRVLLQVVLGFCALGLLGDKPVAAAEDDGLPRWGRVRTPSGELDVRQFGASTGPLAILIHGMMDNDYIHNEWNAVAQKLAQLEFHVVVPNFHSGPPSMQPGQLSADDLRDFVAFAMQHLNERVPARYRATIPAGALVMGKSWGARMALEAGLLAEVKGVAAVVPAVGPDILQHFPRIKGKLAFCFSQDDPIVKFESASAAIREALGSRKDAVVWEVAAQGGHRVLPDFTAPLVEFAESLRPAFSHDLVEEL